MMGDQIFVLALFAMFILGLVTLGTLDNRDVTKVIVKEVAGIVKAFISRNGN